MELRHAIAMLAARGRRFADHWLPRECPLCGYVLGPQARGVCAACLAALPGAEAARCGCCGLVMGGLAGGASTSPDSDPSISLNSVPRRCATCTAQPPAFDYSIVLADYASPLDAVVQALKFHGEFALGAAMGAALANRLAEGLAGGLPPVDALVPIPLAPLRLAGRGYNQSAAIARGVARATRLPLMPGLLWRCRETPAQSTLALAARRSNLAGALRAAPAAAGCCLVVVDDVMTSGATLQAAAAALKAAGARIVINLVAARTP